MGVSNLTGGIIAKFVIGSNPSLSYDGNSGLYSLSVFIGETVYQNIFKDAERCGITVYRDNIDSFIRDMLQPDNLPLQYTNRIYTDDEILAGERLRLYSNEGELDLLKINPLRYICTNGVLKGQIILLNNSHFESCPELKSFDIRSLAFIMPNDAYKVIDCKYLKIYRNKVANDISNLYDDVSTALFNHSLVRDFPSLLNVCKDSGVSIWTLMGMIEFLVFKNLNN